MADASLTPIYERLNGVQQYHPFSAKTFADWASEAGDTIQISQEGTTYTAPVHKQSLVWRGKQMINMTSTGARERTPIERMSNQKENETSAGMSSARGYGGGAGRNIDHLLYEIENPETGLAMRLEANEEYAEMIYTKSGLNELGQQETLMTRIHQNAQAISLEAQRATAAEGTLSGRLTVEADRITQEVTRASAAEGALSGRITTEADRITAEVTRASLAEGVLSGRITVEADRITQEVTRASLAEGVLDGKITVEAGKITQIVSSVGSNGQVTAASICLAINNGGSSATISANKIYLLGETIANTISADYINTKIATIPTLTGIAASFSGNVACAGLLAQQVYVGSGAPYTNISDGLAAVKIAGPTGNTYTLQYKRFSDSTWQDAESFSRATSLSGTWSGGTFTVSATPQGNSISAQLFDVTNADITWSGDTASFPVYANLNGGETKYSTGKTLRVDASSRYSAGYSKGREDYRPDDIRISGKNVIVLNAAGDDVGGPYSCSSIYYDGYYDSENSYNKWNSGSNSSLYYYNTSTRTYDVATGSAKRWYYKS